MRRRLPLLLLAAGCGVVIVLIARTQLQRTDSARPAREGRPVIFVGLDGADWQLLDPLVAQGAMPNLGKLVEEGQRGILETIHPPLSPLVWTTMMTGVGPIEHGILDFTRLNPRTGAREPITSEERRVPAIWNMAAQYHKSVAVFGLWATYPAEEVRGLIVSDRLFSFQHHEGSPPPGVVYPPAREEWARSALNEAEHAIDFAVLAGYLPWLDEAEYRKLGTRMEPYGDPVSALRRILVETRVYHDLAVASLRDRIPDLAIVYIQGTDTIGHVFAPYAPPRQATISADDFRRYGGVVERYFGEIDRMLGDYRDLAKRTDGVLMIASDHGFQWGEGRSDRVDSAAAATAGKWHRDEGIYLLWGSDLSQERGPGRRGGVQQVCATLLALLGLPPGEGLSGPPLAGLKATASQPVKYVVPSRPSAANRDTVPLEDVAEQVAKLRDLGYIGADEPEAGPRAGTTRTAGSYNNEGLILREHGNSASAISAFEHALSLDPHHPSALWNLSETLLADRRDLDRSDELLIRSVAAGSTDGVQHVVARAIGYQRSGDLGRSVQLIDRSLSVRPAEPELWLFRARYRMEQKNCAGALADVRRALGLAPTSALGYATSGLARLCLNDREGAASDFRRSLALDPDQPELQRYLAAAR